MSDFSSLDPCVHCGFCLQACPTYLATSDEADSPRGRIVLMRALERGEVTATDAALLQHLDACLGCRGCEPVCPSGVGYGRGLEAARELLVRQRGLPAAARMILAVFARTWLWRPVFGALRWLRELGITGVLSSRGRAGFGMAMVSATAPRHITHAKSRAGGSGSETGPTVALFRGCVMDGLFSHVHEATRRTLAANGYRVLDVDDQVCCGALHEHAGARDAAVQLAKQNLTAFGERADFIVVDSAGCGALDLEVVYDAPCHLQHAQRVQDQPLAVLRAIPGLRLRLLPGSDRCCGSAGIYSMLQPALSRAVLEAKIAGITGAVPRPAVVATGNPGCLMQIGGGLRAAGLSIQVAHPVELLDWSYRVGGVY